MDRSVVLPEPDGPSMATYSPLRADRRVDVRTARAGLELVGEEDLLDAVELQEGGCLSLGHDSAGSRFVRCARAATSAARGPTFPNSTYPTPRPRRPRRARRAPRRRAPIRARASPRRAPRGRRRGRCERGRSWSGRGCPPAGRATTRTPSSFSISTYPITAWSVRAPFASASSRVTSMRTLPPTTAGSTRSTRPRKFPDGASKRTGSPL